MTGTELCCLSPVHTSNNVEATLSNDPSQTIPLTKSKQIEHVQFAVFGNQIECCFDKNFAGVDGAFVTGEQGVSLLSCHKSPVH